MTDDPLLPDLMPPFCAVLRRRRDAILSEALERAVEEIGGAEAAADRVAAEHDTTRDEIEGVLRDGVGSRGEGSEARLADPTQPRGGGTCPGT